MAKQAMFKVQFEVHIGGRVFKETVHMFGAAAADVKKRFDDIIARTPWLKGRQEFGDMLYDLTQGDVKNVAVKKARG